MTGRQKFKVSWSKFYGPRALYFRIISIQYMIAMLCFGPLEISFFVFFYQLKMVGVGFNYTNPIICSLYVFFEFSCSIN